MSEVKEHPILFTGEMVRAILEGRKTQTRRVVKPQPLSSKSHGGMPHSLMLARDIPLWLTPEEYTRDYCPYGKPGDRLWVRESFWIDKREPKACVIYAQDSRYYKYQKKGVVERCFNDGFHKEYLPLDMCEKAVVDNKHWVKKPSIHMPRWASRITLEITNIRVERIQDINEEDAKAEGVVLLKGSDGQRFVNVSAEHSALSYVEPRGASESIDDVLERAYHYRPHFAALWDTINTARGYSWDSNPWVWVIEFRRINQ
jgi:hypothetical protein